MVKFYVTQIQLGKITIIDVPEMWRCRVERALKRG